MLDIAQLRKDLPGVVARLQTRKQPQPYLDVAAFEALEAERKTLQTRTEALQSQRNQLSKQIGMLKGKGQHAEADAAMAQVNALKGEKQPLPSEELDLRNLSALAVDPRTGHLLVLSPDSNMLLELDEQGQQVSFMTLLGGFNGLEDTIPRAEGVAMDDKGNLYMVSEPALFYRFRKN